ncbi:MAG: UDP-glucose/GDP-mannose dehydrogenase family protein [Syntrophales bacterium]|nr:UDP-glucose/GDP-mannose dehydrogenase family protein [Syntrophales bacterium]
MKLAMVGTGYVGLVTAACFAEMGNEVTCVDTNSAKVEALEQGIIPIYEPGLEDYVKRNSQENRLFFTTDLAAAVQRSLVVFIAVGTPQDKDGSADLSMVLQVARDIGRCMDGYKVIVEKSTVPVGTARMVRQVMEEELRARGEEMEFDVVSNPEFLKEGTALDDFMKPDRIVVGCDDVRVAELMKELYAPFVRTNHPIIIMDVVSAELTKYAANAFLATKISFINEMANICSRTGANINMVRQGIGSDRRIGHLFLFPGLGYGGSCFPKDMQALIHTARYRGYTPRILEAAEAINQDQRQIFYDRVLEYFQGDLKGKVLAFWGLSFKPQTDDIRDAPALTLIEKFQEAGARIQAHDPEGMTATQKYLGDNQGISFVKTSYEAVEGADALIICTEWSKFREPDFDRMRSLMKKPVIFDGRNLYNPEKLEKAGFAYFYIGQKVT